MRTWTNRGWTGGGREDREFIPARPLEARGVPNDGGTRKYGNRMPNGQEE